MQKKFIQRPDGPWKFVQHNEEAHYSAEAVLEVTMAIGKKAMQPAEMRLTDEDIERLLDVPEVRGLLVRRLLGEVPHREKVMAEEDPSKFNDAILLRIQRMLEMAPEALLAALQLPAVQELIASIEEQKAN